ncbi:MAG: TPM domain-containing protein [Oscillospiraceae bacterium]
MGRGGGGSSGGGSSGGGRSFGSSGGRSFSGRSSTSSRGGLGGSGSSSSRGGSDSSSSNRGTNTSYRPTYYSPRYTKVYGSGGGGGGGSYNGGSNNNSSSSGTGTTIAIIVAIAILVFGIIIFCNTGSGDIPKSTIKREPLPAGAVHETGYLTDELNWLNNKSTVEKSMKYFYKKTGVQPYLYITDTVNGTKSPTDSDAEKFATETYDKLFDDEAHLLIIFHESVPSEYSMWQMGGKQAKTVIDDEAVDILFSCIERNYYSDLTDDELFSEAFEKSADRMMKVTKSPLVIIITLVLVLAIISFGFFWWTKIKKQKNLEAEQVEEILNTPLDTFDDDEAAQRAKKYE